MKDLLDVYTRKYDENCILVCMDEVPRQLIGEKRSRRMEQNPKSKRK